MSTNAIQDAVKPLVGLRLAVARRAASMRVFAFGNMRDVEGGNVGDYALHIQCPWRIDGPEGIITGSGDLWEHISGELMPDDWEPGLDDNVQDVALAMLLGGYDPTTESHANESTNLIVERVEASAVGDLVLHLSGGYRLIVFPAGSVGEAWRLFQPGTDLPHLVVEDNDIGFA